MRGALFTAAFGLAATVSAAPADAAAAAVSPDSSSTSKPKLADATLAQLQAGLAAKSFTSCDLVNAYTARIKQVNGTLAVVTEVNPDALSLAAAADARRAKGQKLSAIDGIPVIIKGNIGTNDKMTTTAGSFALYGAQPPADSTIVAKLRAAGAIILGKSNLSQWANYRSYNSTNGWSAYGGQCKSAYYQNADPSGSSSGSGVASSIGLTWASIGSETSGSITFPSSFNNVVGIKPTVGLTSRYLVVPISEHQDTIGPIARTVTDAANLLQIIAGVDKNDNYTSAQSSTVPNYIAALNANALSGARIGIATNVLDPQYFGLSPDVAAAFQVAIAQIKAAGATIVNNANFTAYDDWFNDLTTGMAVTNADFNTNLPAYIKKLSSNPRKVYDVSSVRAFTQSYPAEDYPDRDTGVFDSAITQGYGNTDPRFWPLYQKNLQYGNSGGVLGALSRNNLDAIILPTDVAPDIPALVGSPVISVPMGFYGQNATVTYNARGDLVETAPGVPFGLSFLGKKFDEAKLIGLAYAYEQKSNNRAKGKTVVAPTAEL